MYEAFFGFRERPFQLTPNPRFLYLNSAHREALATLRYGLTSSIGITLLVGGAGTGKTTLLRAALQAEQGPDRQHVVLSNPTLSPADFFEILAEKFGLPDTSGSKGRFLLAFERDLLERHGTGGQTALVIDEAQSLSLEMFEEVRLLANLETETAKLVNVLLVGQPELSDRLNDSCLRQFKQRVVLRCTLPPLDLESTASYIASRLRVVGAIADEVFTKAAVRAIYEASRGIPRTIGVVCENALLAGYSTQQKPVDRAIVVEVCGGLDVPVNGQPAHGHVAVPEQDVVVPARPAPPERRTRAHFWTSSRPAEPRPESARVTGSEAAVARDPTRIFDFF